MATPGDSKRRRTAAYERGTEAGFARGWREAVLTVEGLALAVANIMESEDRFLRPDGMRQFADTLCHLRTLDKRLEKPGKGERP